MFLGMRATSQLRYLILIPETLSRPPRPNRRAASPRGRRPLGRGSKTGPREPPPPGSARPPLSLAGGPARRRAARRAPGGFENREKLDRRLLEASPIGQAGSAYQCESFLRAMENAHRLLSSPSAKAFDLSLERAANVAKYVPAGFEPGKL